MPKPAVEYEEVHRYLSSREPRYATLLHVYIQHLVKSVTALMYTCMHADILLRARTTSHNGPKLELCHQMKQVVLLHSYSRCFVVMEYPQESNQTREENLLIH